MMSDEEIVKTVNYLKGVVWRKYQYFSHVDDLVDEVSLAVMEVLPNTDLNNPRYRSFICKGVMMKISNYWQRYFWDKERKIAKPAATIDHIFKNGSSMIDKIGDSDDNENIQLLRLRLRSELDHLPERERDIFEMSFIDCANVEDIALKYGVSKQRVSQICISTRILLSKRLSVYRGNKSAYDKCKQCGGPTRYKLPLCDNCRAVNRRETLRKTAIRKKESRKVAA